MRTARFTRSDRLLRSRDFKLLSKQGKRAAGRHFVILWTVRPRHYDLGSPRIGITVSRKVGNAVVRNRVKRRVREWYRQNRNGLGDELDILVIARACAGDLGTAETWEILQQMVQQNSLGGAGSPKASKKASE